MKNISSARIEQFAVELTNQVSVVDTKGELDVSQKVYDILSEMDYYKNHPEDLKFVDAEDDKLGHF